MTLTTKQATVVTIMQRRCILLRRRQCPLWHRTLNRWQLHHRGCGSNAIRRSCSLPAAAGEKCEAAADALELATVGLVALTAVLAL